FDAAAGGEPSMLSAVITAMRAAGAPGGLGQGAFEAAVGRAGTTGFAFTGLLVVPRTKAGPGGQVLRRGKAAHIRADLRQHVLPGASVKARHLVQAFDRLPLQRAH